MTQQDINSKIKNEIIIRLYEEADFERLTEIHDPARKNELFLAGLSAAFIPLSIAAVEEDLFSYEVYVAEYGGIVVGFVAFNKDEIAWLYVDVNYSRKGIGKSLVDFALHRVGTKVSIEVLKGNFPAISLYSSVGFQIAETLTGKMPGNEQFSVTVHVMKREQYMNIWNELYEAARKVQNNRTISPFIDAGGVAAAILTKAGNIYVGVCIDTASTLGMCAERNAIANMITNGESQIDKVVAVMPDGRVGSPCGACREYMMQLDKDSGEIEILLELDTQKTVKLKELIPDWWGTERFAE